VEAMMLWPLRRGDRIGPERLQLCQLQLRQLEPTGQPATAVPSAAAAIQAAFKTLDAAGFPVTIYIGCWEKERFCKEPGKKVKVP
jgi:hypothetical protein